MPEKTGRFSLPSREQIFSSRFTAPLAPYFNHSAYWSLNRRSAAKAVAVGLFCGLFPGPTQMLGALIFAYFLRTNLPVAVFTTLYTNPITYMPLYYLAYRIGCLLLGINPAAALDFPGFDGAWWQEWAAWLAGAGKPLLVGVPVLGGTLAFIGYFAVLAVWKIRSAQKWQRRKQRP
ncbi:MAG: DUF2062 domain-containing protein [Neisseria sp.]|nr:DUF2062 domain-containing protein [Neisseria sp.]